MAKLVVELEGIMDPRVDSIRVYPLDHDGFERAIILGTRREIPFESSWVL